MSLHLPISLILRAAAGVVGLLLGATALAQDAWPARTVRLVVPSSAGGGTDLFARLLAQGLSDALKRQFIVDNRPGASGNIGAEIAAKAAPDGYTFFVSASPALVINQSLYKNLPYNAERDFLPVARGVVTPFVFVTHPSLPVKTLPALLALGKREPGKLPYGSAGAGSVTHLGVRLFEEASGARFIHVAYKGMAPASQALLTGEIGFVLSDIASIITHVRSGRGRALAVTLPSAQLPDIPTVASAGYPIEVATSFSVAAPTGTPPAIVERLSVEVVKSMKSPAIREKLENQGFIPVFDTPLEFAAHLKKERQKWADVIRRNKIVVE